MYINRKNPMKTIPAILAVLTILTLIISGPATAQTMYKCVLDGRTIFQAEPCPANAKQDTLKSKVAAPATPTASASAASASAPNASAPAAPEPEVKRIIEFMSSYRACADAVSIWAKEMAGPYGEWRSRNTLIVARIENERQLQTLYQQRVDAKRNGTAGMCRDVAWELRGVTK